jgi:hypothetical protein
MTRWCLTSVSQNRRSTGEPAGGAAVPSLGLARDARVKGGVLLECSYPS